MKSARINPSAISAREISSTKKTPSVRVTARCALQVASRLHIRTRDISDDDDAVISRTLDLITRAVSSGRFVSRCLNLAWHKRGRKRSGIKSTVQRSIKDDLLTDWSRNWSEGNRRWKTFAHATTSSMRKPLAKRISGYTCKRTNRLLNVSYVVPVAND